MFESFKVRSELHLLGVPTDSFYLDSQVTHLTCFCWGKLGKWVGGSKFEVYF